MTVDNTSLGDVAALATALGLLGGDGKVDTGWFADPGGHVRGMLRNQPQRDALVQFIEDALGDDAPPVTDDPGHTWVPLLKLADTPGARSDLFLVLAPGDRGVVVSIGGRIDTTAPVPTSTEIRFPLLRVNPSETAGVTFLPGLDSSDPGDMADATAELTAAVNVADATLNRVGITASLPLTLGSGTPNGTPTVGILVQGLRLPGSSEPLDVALDSASAIGPELTHLLTAILQAEAGSATGPAHDLLGMIGLLPAGGAIPPLPVADILTRGVAALTQWLESVVTSSPAMEAWLGLLADLVGATALPGGPPYGISIPVGGATLDLTVNVATDATGGLVVTPGASLRHATGPVSGVSDARVGVDVDLVRIRLGPDPGVRALPYLQLTARYGGDTGTIADVTSPAVVVRVGALHAGLGLDDDRKPVFVLGAERVSIGPDATHLHLHDVLDLTSPDALAEVAGEALDAIIAGMLAGLGPAGQAIEVLLGIAPPASHTGDATWPGLSLSAFVADPIGAVGAFLRDVVALGGNGFADLLSVLPDLIGVSAAFTADGTPDAPWSLELASGTSLVVWHDGNPTVLHAGVRTAPAIPPLGGAGGPVLGLGVAIEGLSITLPPAAATGTPLPVSVTALPEIAVEVTISAPTGEPFTFGGGYEVSLQEARLRLAWTQAAGLQVTFDLPGTTVTVGGVPTALPPIPLGPGGRFSLPLDLPLNLVEQVALSALRSASADWARSLPALLGAESGAFDQAGGLAALISDPLRFAQRLLAAFMVGQGADEFLIILASTLAALTSGPAGVGVSGGLVNGSGTPADPYAVSVGDGTAALEATLWLDPEGPPVDLNALTAALQPEALGRWLDGDPGAPALNLATVAGLLEQAAAQVAGLAGLLAGRTALTDGLAALAARITGGDGLLPGAAVEVPGATAFPIANVTHPQLSAAADLAAILGAAPDPSTTVYVTGPLEPAWPGLDARTFDLTQAGLAATGFDVSRAAGEDGPWHVRLPGRAACPGTDADSQLVAQTARLQQVVDAVASRHPAQVVLVAHGSAGQAARLLASQDAAVAQLVLLGVPAAGLSLDVLDVPPAADVVQLLCRLLPAPDPAQPDDPNLAAGRAVLGTLAAVYASALAPTNDFRPPQALGSLSPPTWSVRGALDADTTIRALAAAIRAGLESAWPAGSAPRPAPTALRGGLRMTVSSAPATVGPGADGVAVDVAASLDLGLLALTGGPAPAPALSLAVTLARPGGWLVGGPQGVPASPDLSRTPSLRRAELRASADLGGPGGARAQIVLDEVDALTLVADQVVLGDGDDPVTPEVRVLLGRLAGALGPAPPGSRVAGVVELLRAAGLTDPAVTAPAVGLSVDAITRMVVDPSGQLRGALSAAPARAAAAAALRLALGDTTGTGTQAGLTLGGVTFAVDLAAPTASLRVSTANAGLELPGGLTAILDATVDAQGHWNGSIALAPSGEPGPAGRPALRIAAGAAGPTVDVRIDGGLAGLPGDLSLWPLPRGASVAGMLPTAAALFAGQLARDLLTELRALDPDHLDPILTYLGLLEGTGSTARVRLAAGLVTDPGGWLRRALGGSGIDADRVASLVDAVRALSGLPSAAHGTLPLPFGIELSAGPDVSGALRIGLAVAEDAGDLHLALNGGLAIPTMGPPVPVLGIGVGPTGTTAALQVGLDGSSLTAALRLSNGDTLQLYPSGPGLGSLASSAATAALPLVLDQLAAHGPAPVPAVLTTTRTVLGLGATTFDPAQLRQLAADPAGELERRLAANGPGALAQLLGLAQPVLPSGWAVDTTDPQAVTLRIGTAPTQQEIVLRYSLMPAAFSIGATVGIDFALAGVGIVGNAHVNLDGTGLRLVDTTIGIDPARPVSVGPATLAPFARVVAGVDAAGGAHAETGIAVTADAHVHALVATLAIGPPVAVTLGTQTDGQPDIAPDIGTIVTGFIIPVLADVALSDPTVATLLGKTALGTATVGDLLQGVLLKGADFDPGVLDLDQAVPRLLRLGGNVAAANPSVVIGDHLRLEIAHVTDGARKTYGVGVTVDNGEGVPLTTGDIILAIEVDSTWTDILGDASPGVSILVLDQTADVYSFAASPAVVVNGAGVRVSRASGALLDEGLQIDSVALYGLLEIDDHGVQAAGGKLELAGLGVAVADASGGENGVAQGVLGSAGSGGGSGQGDNTPLRPKFSPSLALEKPANGALKWALRAGDGDGPWWIVIQRSFGPLHIEQIGFGVDQDGSTVHGVRVLLDGGLSMLGLAIDVEELSVGARWPVPSGGGPPLTARTAWTLDLAGLAVGYSGGAVSLAGALRKRGSPPDYTGVLIAHLGPYGLTAFGGYGQFAAPDGSKYTSLFVIAGITAPIGGPPAFFVTGLGGGAGINRQLVLPATLDDFPNYPLVAAIDPHSTLASDPEHALDELSSAFPPERGNFWFAAGVSFTCFALVDVTAVVAVSVGDGFQLALLGLGRMALPTTEAPLVEVELALQARFSTKEGVLIIQAQLTQNSWLLTSDCRLTGGFAYASFFGDNPNAGQFVLSIGGYHPSFHHDGYPVVPRVGYIWSVASVLTISGQSYFALTSEAIMAGTRFTAALDLGFLWASLTLGIDAIVYFDPFAFVADGYASIAAGVTIDIDLGWFGDIEVSLSFHLGATVHVLGPDFRGSASIDLDVTSATIAFGSDNDTSTQHLSWPEFTTKYLTAGGASTLSGMPQLGQLTGTPTTPAGTTPTGDADKPWKLVAEWSLSVTTTAAATQLQLPATALSYSLSEAPGIASMAIDSLTSTLTVTMTGSAGGDVSPPILGPDDPGEGLHVVPVTAPLPKGVWSPNPNDASIPSGDTITAGTGFVLQATATVEGETPPIANNQIEPPQGRKPLPFLEETAARPARQPDDTNAAAFGADQPQSADAALATALDYLHTGPVSVPVSPMAAAAFGRDRVAPPKLGLLTEGMVSPQTPAPTLTPIVPVPPPIVDTSIYPPVIAAILDGGPAIAQRPVLRTSAQAALKRATQGAVAAVASVQAPTLASVAALTDPALAAVLVRQAPTALVAETGLRAADGGPVSLRAATPAELRAGAAVTPDQLTQLESSGTDLLADGLVIRPGRLVLVELPNAARDLDATLPRHSISVQGDAAVRVVALTVTGRVLLDMTGLKLDAPIPQHTARVAFWCVGGDATRPAGLAGWTDVSRLPQVGTRTLLGADAVINGAASARRGPAAVSAASVPAAGAVAGPAFTTTQLPADTAVVVVCLEPTGDDRDLTGLTLGLDGASRATGADGAAVPPTLVTAGARMHLLYTITAADAASPLPGVEVTVGTDARWGLVGVLGGPADVATTAIQLGAHGAAAVAAPLIRAPTGSAQVAWSVPPEVS